MEPNKTYIIQHKETKELFRARSGKTSWKAPGHAKNAFNQSVYRWNYQQLGLELVPTTHRYTSSGVDGFELPKFNEQDVYEVIELKHNDSTQLDKAVVLLTECLGRCDYQLQKRIEEFLEELR